MFQKKILQNKIHSGGFVFIELAIALPLLILLMYGLGLVGIKIFELGRAQLADYVLESEAQYVMERITRTARVAKRIEADNSINKIKIFYCAATENSTNVIEYIDDILETQIFTRHRAQNRQYHDLYAQRQDNAYSSPITGNNHFGDTRINSLTFSKLNENVLRIELEMESLTADGHKIKIATAVFMPGCESLKIIESENK